ncbi:MAG: STAS domain-containing protein [Planctomycetes bacterium]|nr:STAS domain-containing protein [Planctomycetota bacterium]
MPCDFLLVEAYDKIVLAKVMKERLLDPVSIASLSEGLSELVDRHPRINLVIDAGDIGYLSSAMLGKLVALFKAIKAAKGRMAIGGVKPSLMPLFKVTQLDKIITFYPDAGQAVTEFRRNPL